MAHIGFDNLKAQLAKKGIKNPGGLAYKIGAKKYGAAKMHKAAAEGKPANKVK